MSASYQTFAIPINKAYSVVGAVGTGSATLGSFTADFNFVQNGAAILMAMQSTTATVTTPSTGIYSFPAGTVPAAIIPMGDQTMPTLIKNGGNLAPGFVTMGSDGSLVFGLVPTSTLWADGAALVTSTTVPYNLNTAPP